MKFLVLSHVCGGEGGGVEEEEETGEVSKTKVDQQQQVSTAIKLTMHSSGTNAIDADNEVIQQLGTIASYEVCLFMARYVWFAVWKRLQAMFLTTDLPE